MKKSKNLVLVVICFILMTMLVVVSSTMGVYAIGDNVSSNKENVEFTQESDIPTPQLLATLSLSIKGGDHKVIATVRNDFTLFPSTVNVIVQLFYSDTYCEDYNQMTLAAMNSTDDLNMGKAISVEASTGGEERFWMARMRFKENNGSWKSDTVTGRYTADGTYLGIA